MSEYYAVIRSTDHLAHYGVKGMKWGVRRAIKTNSPRRLARHYKKARRKLDRLERNADVDTQKRLSARYNKAAKISAGIGGAGLVGAVGSHGVYQILKNNLIKKAKGYDQVSGWSYSGKVVDALQAGDHDTYKAMKDAQSKALHDYSNAKYDFDKHSDNAVLAKKISAGVAVAGLGTAAGLKAKSMIAKYRTTKKGHTKAQEKARSFAKAMSETFNQPQSQMMSTKVIGRLSNAASKSVRKKIDDKIKNQQFSKDQRRNAEQKQQKILTKQKKRRERLERKIGKLL